MPNQKYPPRGDQELLAAGEQFETNAGSGAAFGLTAADITRLTAARSDAETAFAARKVSQAQARADRTAKDEKMQALEDILSESNRRVQPLTTVSDAARTTLGIPVYDKTPTAATPDALPTVKIDTATPLRHEITFSGEESKGKPAGVKAMEIYLKIGGDATGDAKDYQFLAQDSESPYTKDFDAADSGKQAHYLFCWVNSSGERGPWQMASATVTSQLQSEGV